MIGSYIYQLVIAPLELLLEVIFGMAMKLFHNHGLAILLMSLVMNILLLPLYQQADAIQEEEREAEKRMEHWVKHIKKSFKGDERFMMLQTYYSQNHYKPYYTLKSSLPLALEIPFFIAAYHFLSNLGELNGSALGPIENLGIPDGMITIGSITLNLLPVIMTLINVISCAIYTKGFALKDKITLYGMAVIFLVLLYNSPAGLVFYWTLNNLFSLVKNLFYKLKNPKKVLYGLVSLAGALLLVYSLFFYHTVKFRHKALLVMISLMMEFPLLMRIRKSSNPLLRIKEQANYNLFLLGGIFLSVVTGLMIPSAVVSSSPEEFVLLGDFHTPVVHVLYAAVCAVGLFVLWFGIFYYLLDKKARRVSEITVWTLSGIAVADYMFFGTGLGGLTADLTYENDTLLKYGDAFSLVTSKERIINILVVIAILIVFVLLYRRAEKFIKAAYYVLIIAATGLSIVNMVQIQKAVPHLQSVVRDEMEAENAQFNLSKTGNNVVVIMLDRAISGYIPFIFQEKPELERQFTGFTYYPNTVSFGSSTNTGSPEIFGGYEYIPTEMNKRSDMSLVSKHNEALKVMPVLFDEAGYEVTICDPVYAGYTWIPDLSIYDEYPDFHVYNTEYGQFSSNSKELATQQNALWRRNFFCYSIMKISPLIVQTSWYQNGTYFNRSTHKQTIKDLSHSEGINTSFVESYAALCALPEMTHITESGDTYLVFTNQATHEPCLLEEPDYCPSDYIDNSEYDSENESRFSIAEQTMKVETVAQMTHYHVNVASLLQVGNWLDYLRENGVYDNTRIIIVADHGRALHQFEDTELASGYDAMMAFNPLFLVKDFGAEAFSTNTEFMTNADVPILAMKDLIRNPTNPFTGKRIDNTAKEADELLLLSSDWDTKTNNGNVFLPGDWFSIHDNIFNKDNWKELGTW